MKIQQLANYKDFFELLSIICRSAAEFLYAKASSIYLIEGDHVIMHAAYGYSADLIHKAKYKLGEGITGWIAEGSCNELIANSKEELCNHHAHRGKYDSIIWPNGDTDCYSLIAIPLLIGGEVYGLIKVENKYFNNACCSFSKEDVKKLRIFLGALSDAIKTNKEAMAILGKFFVFVLMPFKDELLNVYDSIQQASNESNLFCSRSDDEPIIGKVSEKIYESIRKADIIVSVMTERNANVFYETGYAHAIQKPTVHISENPREIPFDLQDYSHIIYKPTNLPELRYNLKMYYKHIKNKYLQ